jgi:hypothetical protein
LSLVGSGTRTVKNSYGSSKLGAGLQNVVDFESSSHTLPRIAGLRCTVPCDCSPPRPPTGRTELHAYQTACSRTAHDLNQKTVLEIRIRMFFRASRIQIRLSDVGICLSEVPGTDPDPSFSS